MYCENGCDLIQTCDPCSSGDMISPKMYEQHVVPTLEGLTSQLKNCETFLLHICGKAGMRLPHVKALGIDGFSVTPPWTSRNLWRPQAKNSLWWGISIPMNCCAWGRVRLCMPQRTPMPKSPAGRWLRDDARLRSGRSDTIGKYFGHGQGLFRLRGQRQKLSGEAAWRKTFGTLT